MLTPPDLIRLPCPPDLVESGLACACRSLAYASTGPVPASAASLRFLVASVAVELAFRRHLDSHFVPFTVLPSSPFSDPDHFDVSLGMHRCLIQSSLVSNRRRISLLRRQPGLLLQASALVPLERAASAEGRPDDIFLFAFLLGLLAASRQDMDRALAAGQPLHLLHPLPAPWARPASWQPLQDLALKSECDRPVAVHLGGLDPARSYVACSLDLPPHTRVPVPGEWCSVSHLHVLELPAARIGIHSPRHGAPHIVPPSAWENLWVYGMQVCLTGWLTRENFHRKASLLEPGSSAPFVGRLSEKTLRLPIADLNPLPPLFSRVRAWAQEKQPQDH